MIPLSLLLLTQTVIGVAPSHWTAIELNVPQNGSTVHVSFEVQGEKSQIQLMILSREEAERFDKGRSTRPLFASGFEHSGDYRVFIPDAGRYVLMLDNRLQGRLMTQVSLKFDISHPADIRVKTVPPEQRRATIALSLLFFGAVLVFSAAKFLRN